MNEGTVGRDEIFQAVVNHLPFVLSYWYYPAGMVEVYGVKYPVGPEVCFEVTDCKHAFISIPFLEESDTLPASTADALIDQLERYRCGTETED